MTPELPFVHIAVNDKGDVQVTSNVQIQTFLFGMLEQAKFVLVTGQKKETPSILPANGNPLTDRILKMQGP